MEKNEILEELILDQQEKNSLSRSEYNFLNIFHGIPDMMSINNFNPGHYVEVNDAWLKFSGYERHEVIGHTPMELGIWVDEEEQEIRFMNLDYNVKLNNHETRYRMKSGEIRSFLISTVVIELGGEPHLFSVLKDITDRKRMEEALRSSEDKFSKAFNANPEGIVISTLEEGRIVEVNDAWVEGTGYERYEVIGHTGLELGVWETAAELDGVLKIIQQQGNIRNYETTNRMKSGEIRSYLLSAEKALIGEKAHLISVYKDITNRKRMEEALRLSEELFSKAFNTSPIPMSISTLEEGRFINVNESFCQVIDYSREEIRGRTAVEMGFWINPQERERVKKQILRKEIVRDVEMYFGRKNGEKRMGLYSAEEIEINGVPCLLSVVMDITDRRKLEIEMTRLDRLNLVGEVAASIGHEIRNPMTTVRGYLQLLQNREKYCEDQSIFALMIEELDRANEIITEFLSLTNNDQVRLRLQNLNTIVVNIFPLIQANVIAQDKHVRLIMEDLPDLMLDDKEIRQILLNLVCNGLEAMPEGGILSIRTFVEDGYAVLAIQDEGEGIDLKTLGKIGTPFFTTKEKGTGLGLAVCYRIAARHRARIDIETGIDGTTFYVRFSID